jgi:hypothetical protein
MPCLGKGLYQRELSKIPIFIIATVLPVGAGKSMELEVYRGFLLRWVLSWLDNKIPEKEKGLFARR